jgi:DNA (cytosine-5)-methyltransferase 1
MNELALFAGAGGGILGGKLLGWRTVCAVEFAPYAASVLAARQNDGLLPAFPIWDDVRTFDGLPWRGVVDVVSGGFPCQDISLAGTGKGLDGERSGLWGEMARVIREVRPRFALVENSPALTSRGLGTVLGDLAEMGFDAEWGVLGADAIGANHRRDRIWIVAHAQLPERWPASAGGCGDSRREDANGLQGREEDASRAGAGSEVVADTDEIRRMRRARTQRQSGGVESTNSSSIRHTHGAGLQEWFVLSGCQGEAGRAQQGKTVERADWWLAEPNVGRVAHGVAARVDRLTALGNGQVPQCAAAAWRLLTPNV